MCSSAFWEKSFIRTLCFWEMNQWRFSPAPSVSGEREFLKSCKSSAYLQTSDHNLNVVVMG